jgi:hypothetical protein
LFGAGDADVVQRFGVDIEQFDAHSKAWHQEQAKNAGEKKPATLRERVNPIQGELEETGVTLSCTSLTVCFNVVISVIHKAYITEKPARSDLAGLCLSSSALLWIFVLQRNITA